MHINCNTEKNRCNFLINNYRNFAFRCCCIIASIYRDTYRIARIAICIVSVDRRIVPALIVNKNYFLDTIPSLDACNDHRALSVNVITAMEFCFPSAVQIIVTKAIYTENKVNETILDWKRTYPMVFWWFVPARANKTASIQIWMWICTTVQNHATNKFSDETTVYVLQVLGAV